MKSGSLNLLEPSVPVEACNGIALAFYMYRVIKKLNTLMFYYLATNTYCLVVAKFVQLSNAKICIKLRVAVRFGAY